MLWVGVALAGAAGASLRFVVDHVVSARTAGGFPWGVAVVNLSGAFLVGLVAGSAARGLDTSTGIVLSAGFCGAYTTVSTLMYHTVVLAERRAWGAAALNMSTLALGWAAAAAGWALAAP